MADSGGALPLLSHHPTPYGVKQLLLSLFVALAWAFDSQQTFIAVFTDAMPPWHCLSSSAECISARSSDPCSLPEDSWAWDRDPTSSVVSEWALQCAGPAVSSLPAAAYFAGCFAGGFLFVFFADDSRLGRKRMLVASLLVMLGAAALTSAAPNLAAYSALRFVSGLGRSAVGASAIVLSTEMVGERWCDAVSVAGFVIFTLGFLSLPPMAYALRSSSWRSLYLWTSIPSLCYTALVIFIVPESSRWQLVVRARREEGDVFAAMKLLLEKKWAMARVLAVMTASVGIGLLYYGMPLSLGSFSSNLYASVAYNAAAELPASLATFVLLRRLNRRSSLLALTSLAGACSLLICVIGAGAARDAAEVVAFFAACTAFDLIMVYSIELFPTCVRNTAMSLVRQALVMGGLAAPALAAATRTNAGWSFGIFGGVIGVAGLVVLWLPETRGTGMSDTMEEEEDKGLERTVTFA